MQKIAHRCRVAERQRGAAVTAARAPPQRERPPDERRQQKARRLPRPAVVEARGSHTTRTPSLRNASSAKYFLRRLGRRVHSERALLGIFAERQIALVVPSVLLGAADDQHGGIEHADPPSNAHFTEQPGRADDVDVGGGARIAARAAGTELTPARWKTASGGATSSARAHILDRGGRRP